MILTRVLGGAAFLSAIAAAFLFWQLGKANEKVGTLKADLKGAEDKIVLLEAEVAMKDNASLERADDEREVRSQDGELQDARSQVDDTAAMQRARSLCVRMQQQGRDVSQHPTCSRLIN